MLDWEELEGYANRCARCALCRTRNHVVFGVGNREADIIFIVSVFCGIRWHW